ncbi:syndecan-3 isoform X2 [Salvelinus fontinalis]|uniref:syndecan-3 isoform X2 n=1 Tax=Salvelinus fontinalis TaxID=8038 RepID=UPI0024850829|nr:syndecan-3 isoform X2 [Salvelinus fontinalis]
MKLPPCLMTILAALLAHSALGQTWVPSIDPEGSSGDEFYDDEDLFSGSGSGFPEVKVNPTAVGVSFTTEEPLPLSTTQATGPAPSAPPAAEPNPNPDALPTPLPTEGEGESGIEWERGRERERERERERVREMERERERERERDREREREKERERERERERQREIERERERERERARAAQTTISPRGPAAVPMATTSTATPLAESAAPSSGVQDLVTTEEEDEDVYLSPDPTTSMPMETTTEEEEEEEEVTTTETETTPLPETTAPPTTIGPALAERSSSTPFRPSVLVTTPTKATPTERSTRPQQPSTTMNNELGVNGPSGDFEIREEDRRQGNEVVGRGRGMETGAEPDLIGNTINTGSSAAQLPQKNILERKEVLIAVIVGGVVGALFAAFLVMLLVYRMKKKDEGSYTLEEPKQATVTYQKADKQEEFYA